ncbi:hypothetical protein CaCOL14_003957 [Colletotrichum acutatum]
MASLRLTTPLTRRMNLDLTSLWPITNPTLGHDQCDRPSFSIHPGYLFFTEWRSISRKIQETQHTAYIPKPCLTTAEVSSSSNRQY